MRGTLRGVMQRPFNEALALPRAFAALALLVAGCASLPTPPGPAAPVVAADTPFVIGGRLSARRGNAGIAGAFAWTHDASDDAIELSTPLGQTIARLEGKASEVTVRLSDGRVEHAPTWRSLTEIAFGITIPVDGLAWWIRALPRPNARYGIDRDASGRVALLRQDGWEIVYAYDDAASQRPLRVTLDYPGADPVEIRVVVDRWQ